MTWRSRSPAACDDSQVDDFVPLALELVDDLLRAVLMVDEAFRDGNEDVDAVNDAFRQAHTLAGPSTLTNHEDLQTLARAFEGLLDDLRLGQIALVPPIVETMLRLVEVCSQVVSALQRDKPAPRNAIRSVASTWPRPRPWVPE